MKQQKAQIILLQPTEAQREYFARAAGVARHAYNWALEWRNKQWEMHKAECADCASGDHERKKNCKLRTYTGAVPKPNTTQSWNAWNEYKKKHKEPDAERHWLYEISANVPKWAIYEQLDRAFKNWWNKATKAGPPNFKSKRTARRVFVGLDSCKPSDFRHRGIRLQKLGWVRCRSKLRWPAGLVRRVTVYQEAGKWYASVLFEDSDYATPVHENQEGAVGVDLGSRKLAVTYDGKTARHWENPKALDSVHRRIRRWSRRAVRRGRRDSKGRVLEATRGLRDANKRLARLHKRAADIRRWHQHDVSNALTRDYGIVGTEDLNVKGMMGGLVARALADAGMGELLRQIEYKAEWRGGERRKVGRFFPSSKTCSDCGYKNDDLKSRERWVCPNCGVLHDRDENAAMNIYKEVTVGRSNPEPTDLIRERPSSQSPMHQASYGLVDVSGDGEAGIGGLCKRPATTHRGVSAALTPQNG